MNQKILHVVLFTPMGLNALGEEIWGIPTILWGEPGIGKSAVCEQLGPRYQSPWYTLSPAEQGEGAFGVFPVPDADCRYLLNPLAEWVRPFDAAERGVLVIDEMQLAAGTPVEKPLLRLSRARALGARYLPGGVRILAASNPAEISGGFDMLPALENRFFHWDILFDYQAWKRWIQAGARNYNPNPPDPIDPAIEEARILKIFNPEYLRAFNIITAFLDGHPDMAAPNTADPRWIGKKARPSPRTWEYTARVIASSKIHALPDEDRETIICGLVGVEAGSQFCSYLENLDLPTAMDILSGAWAPDPARLDIVAIAVQTATSYVIEKENQDTANKLWKIFELLCDIGAADIVISAAEDLAAAGLVEFSSNGKSSISEAIIDRVHNTMTIARSA